MEIDNLLLQNIYKNMEKQRVDEEMVLFATAIAMELARGLCAEEIENLRNLVNQISLSLGTLIGCKFNKTYKK